MNYSKKDLLYYWRLTKSIGARRIKRQDFDHVRHVDNDVFGMVRKKNTLIFVFAGSNDWKDWCSNLRTMKRPSTDDVHIGFYRSAKKLREPVRNLISINLYDYYDQLIDETLLIGHSRGKALAVEISRYLKKYLDIDNKVIGFGAPREGGKKHFEECMDLGLFVDLYEYPRDLVTELPFGFVKYGTIHLLKQPWWFRFPIFRYIHCNYQHGIKKGETCSA